MKSSYTVDFSLRQNKAIERTLVFDGLKILTRIVGQGQFVYVGLGSVWFIEFDMAHRQLGIETMLSIEGDDLIFKRAEFNKPYRTIRVFPGMSYDVIPGLMADEAYMGRPWIVWLDYDDPMDETYLTELEDLIVNLAPNSIVLCTFHARPGTYESAPTRRRAKFIELFGDAFPDEEFATTDDVKDERRVMAGLARAVLNRLESKALQIARPGGFIPAFNLHYQDSAPMVTVGGMLPAPELAEQVAGEVHAATWPGIGPIAIVTPPLTAKEVWAMRRLLPTQEAVSRKDIQNLGFDLEDGQLDAFLHYYLRYPSFVETAR